MMTLKTPRTLLGSNIGVTNREIVDQQNDQGRR